MSKILIVAEHLNGQLNASTARCVTCAKEINPEAIDVLVLADAPEAVAAQAAKLDGVSKVLTVNTSICAAGAQVNVADLQSLNATLFPALIQLVGSLPMLPNQPAVMLGLTLAQPILAQVVQTIEAQKAAAPVAASSSK